MTQPGPNRRDREDRRKSEQPTKSKDRRKEPRRVAAVPLEEFRWETTVPTKPPFWSALLTKRALLIGIPGLLLLAAVTGIALHQPAKPPPPKREVVAQRPQGAYKQEAKKVQAKQDTTRSLADRMRTDILNIAPEIYYTVTLEMTERGKDRQKDIVSEVEIAVRSGPWDDLSRPHRVELLKRTYDLLRTRYPSITRTVRLIFDDGRSNLPLKFDD